MADTQYDVSEKILKLYHLKQKQRNESKAYFAKLMENPHRPVDEGAIFDSGLFRHAAMDAYKFEQFKATPKTTLRSICIFVIPAALLFMHLKTTVESNEKLMRSGMVAYKDRKNKLYL